MLHHINHKSHNPTLSIVAIQVQSSFTLDILAHLIPFCLNRSSSSFINSASTCAPLDGLCPCILAYKHTSATLTTPTTTLLKKENSPAPSDQPSPTPHHSAPHAVSLILPAPDDAATPAATTAAGARGSAGLRGLRTAGCAAGRRLGRGRGCRRGIGRTFFFSLYFCFLFVQGVGFVLLRI